MRRNGALLLVVALVILVVLLATDTLSIRCDTDDITVPEAIEEAGDNLEDAAEELTDG